MGVCVLKKFFFSFCACTALLSARGGLPKDELFIGFQGLGQRGRGLDGPQHCLDDGRDRRAVVCFVGPPVGRRVHGRTRGTRTRTACEQMGPVRCFVDRGLGGGGRSPPHQVVPQVGRERVGRGEARRVCRGTHRGLGHGTRALVRGHKHLEATVPSWGDVDHVGDGAPFRAPRTLDPPFVHGRCGSGSGGGDGSGYSVTRGSHGPIINDLVVGTNVRHRNVLYLPHRRTCMGPACHAIGGS